jgi:hypothetical protein
MNDDAPSNCSMWARGAIAAIECSITVIVVFSVPGFAQSDSVSRADTTRLVAVRAPSVMRVYGSDLRTERSRVGLPLNLRFPEAYRETIESMLDRSPTFRRQCVRLAHAPEVAILLQTLHPYAPGDARARTTIAREAGNRLVATVAIRALDDLPELIAHEIEHVIEQIDGVDLRVQSLLPGTGVRSCRDGSFETIRAVRVGVRVAEENRTRR